MRDLAAHRIQQVTSRLLAVNQIIEPLWYRAVAASPPAALPPRSVPLYRDQERGLRKRKKPLKLLRPQEIIYPEDRLRKRFYQEHPWELSQPRIILEDQQPIRRSGKAIPEPGVALNGEAFVARQHYLMENDGMPEDEAYEQACREFYRARMQEALERRVSEEEARHNGAQFGSTLMEIGSNLDAEAANQWKAKAVEASRNLAQRRMPNVPSDLAVDVPETDRLESR